MHTGDRKFLDLKESKNRLETLCYKFRDGLQGKLAPFMEEQARNAVLKEINSTVDWLYAEGENSTVEEYDKRYKKLYEVCNPCNKRYIFAEGFATYFTQFDEVKDYCSKRLASEELAHLTEEQRNKVNAQVEQVAEFFKNLLNEVNTKQKHEDISVSLNDIDKKLSVLRAETNSVFNTPKPKP